MLIAWRRVSDLPEDAVEARMWLFGIARNVLLNAQRSSRRRHRLANRLRTVLDTSPMPAADEGAEVRDAIAALHPDLAELVRLVHWDGFTLADAAAVVGIPASTARGRYQRAKEELRITLSAPAEPSR
jgi:RNA polymerase sigma-70 factor (ECF subfamily)